MMSLSDDQKTMLENYRTLVLPASIESDLYEMMLEVTFLYPDDWIYLHCRGDGGDTRTMLSVADLITSHGRFIGVLAGVALSCHGIIWASCTKRYVYPHGSMGIHEHSIYVPGESVVQSVFEARADELRKCNSLTATIFASASDVDADTWRQWLSEHGASSYKFFDADRLIDMQMAKPIVEIKNHD